MGSSNEMPRCVRVTGALLMIKCSRISFNVFLQAVDGNTHWFTLGSDILPNDVKTKKKKETYDQLCELESRNGAASTAASNRGPCGHFSPVERLSIDEIHQWNNEERPRWSKRTWEKHRREREVENVGRARGGGVGGEVTRTGEGGGIIMEMETERCWVNGGRKKADGGA